MSEIISSNYYLGTYVELGPLISSSRRSLVLIFQSDMLSVHVQSWLSVPSLLRLFLLLLVRLLSLVFLMLLEPFFLTFFYCCCPLLLHCYTPSPTEIPLVLPSPGDLRKSSL